MERGAEQCTSPFLLNVGSPIETVFVKGAKFLPGDKECPVWAEICP